MIVDNEETTPTFIQTVQSLIDKKLCDLNTSLPAEIVRYDYDKNLAVVQPTLKRKYKSENSAVNLPNISNVPVAFQRMGNAHLRIPINIGDTGQLFFSQRSIDGWLVSGGIIDPLDPRKFSLSDAIFYPGLNVNSNPIRSSSDEKSVELKLNNSWIEITDTGKFKLTDGTEELFDLMVQTLGKMVDEMTEQSVNDFTNTVFGPQQPINAAAYASLKTDSTELFFKQGNYIFKREISA